MNYYTLYETLRTLKESQRHITMFELNKHLPIDDIHELTTKLLHLFPPNPDHVTLLDHSIVDPKHAITLLKKIRDEKLSIVRMFGPNRVEAFETFKSKYESYIHKDVFNGLELGDQEIIFAVKSDVTIKDRLTSLSTLPTYISLIGLHVNDFYANGKRHEARILTFTCFEYLQSFHMGDITLSTLYLAQLLLDLKENNELAYNVLLSNYDKTFVQSLLKDIKPEARKRRTRRHKQVENELQMMQYVEKIVDNLDEESYMNYTYDFVRDYLI